MALEGRLLALTNNTVSEGAVNNGKSRDLLVNREWKIIQEDLLRHDSAIVAKRVRSADNAADALSRGLDTTKRYGSLERCKVVQFEKELHLCVVMHWDIPRVN